MFFPITFSAKCFEILCVFFFESLCFGLKKNIKRKFFMWIHGILSIWRIFLTNLFSFYKEFTIFVVAPRWFHLGGEAVGAHIYIKGVTERFGFDCVRTSQLQTVCQKQSNGNVSWDVYIQPLLAIFVADEEKLYTHQRGAFGVARFDRQGNAKALTQWNEWQDWLHVFCVCMYNHEKRWWPFGACGQLQNWGQTELLWQTTKTKILWI